VSICIWKYNLNSGCVSSPQLSSDNDRLYVATLNGDILALKSNDADLLWKISLNKPIFSTIALWKNTCLIVGCVDQKLYCLNCDTGEQVRCSYEQYQQTNICTNFCCSMIEQSRRLMYFNDRHEHV
jgi:outer membrane protein assembly factor BamB